MAQFTESQRESLSEENLAMPDGSYPIRNRQDLKNAIASYGRTKHPEKVKRWIIKRARDLNATDLIPDSWGTDSVSHSLYLRHYGVKGMKWGVRRAQKQEARRKAARSAHEKAISRTEDRLKRMDHDLTEMLNVANDQRFSYNDRYTAYYRASIVNDKIERGKSHLNDLKGMNIDRMSARKIKKGQDRWERRSDKAQYMVNGVAITYSPYRNQKRG